MAGTLARIWIEEGRSGAIVSFFRHCQEEGWVTKLPTAGLKVRDPIANRDKRRTFTLTELQRVFGPGWKRECKGDDHRFHTRIAGF